MQIPNLLAGVLELILLSGSLVVDGQFLNFGRMSDKKMQTRNKDGLFRASISTNLAAKSQSISFLLYTRENKMLPEIVTPMNISLSEYYSMDRETKIIIHSFMQAPTDKIYSQIKDAYLNVKDLNVIMVDWPHARAFTYSISSTITDYVGLQTARLITSLGVPLDRIHIIGFGLGAHSGGVAGVELDSKVGRITGLDPSMPLFRMLDDYYKLDESDGQFVDIIHTDAGDNFWYANHLGLGKPSGSVDFYPNKGIFQPGCLNTSILNYEDMYCSHIRSLELFAESIENPRSLMACKCSTWVAFMDAKCDCSNEENLITVGEGNGTDVEYIAGRYYLITHEVTPYGMGIRGSRSPRENALHDIMDDLDKLAKIALKKGNARNLTDLRMLAEKLFLKEEIRGSKLHQLFNNASLNKENEEEEEQIRDIRDNEEHEEEENLDLKEDEESSENENTMENMLPEMNPTQASSNVTDDHIDAEIDKQKDYENSEGGKSDQSDEYKDISDDLRNEKNENSTPAIPEITSGDNSTTEFNKLKDNGENERNNDNMQHLIYIIGTQKNVNDIDTLKEYRIL